MNVSGWERDALITVRAIQAAQRDNRARNREWLGNLLPVIDHPNEILEQEPGDNVVVDRLEEEEEEEIVQPETVLVPEEELGENYVGADNDEFVLEFDNK